MRTAVRIIGVVVVLAVAAGLFVLAFDSGDDDTSGNQPATEPAATTTSTLPASPVAQVDAYIDAWEAMDWAAMAELTVEAPPDFADQHQEVLDALRAEDINLSRGAIRSVADPLGASDAPVRAAVPFTAEMTLVGLGPWSYDGEIDMVGTANGWRVDWSPATIHPAFELDGYDLRRSRVWPTRGPILYRNDEPIVASAEVVEVGVEPRRIDDIDELAAVLDDQLEISREELDAALDAPGVQPNFFVPLAQLSPADWAAVRDVVLPVPGVLVRETTARTPPGPDYLRQTLGRYAEITAEQLEELGAPYAVGDLVGSGGIEGAYESLLAGTPSGEVRLIDDFGDDVDVLAEFSGTDSSAVRTTIDPVAQLAAEAALADVTQPAALVAVDGNGDVRALVSSPADGFHRAIGGRYPPGSTFKLVTAYGLLSNGVTPETVVACPSDISVGGRTFANFEGGSLGDIPFATAFRESCNTAFIGAADQMGDEPLADAAASFGFGPDYTVGLTTFPGMFPEVVDSTENAAASIGQGRVEASPVHMASVAAAIASDTWNPPILVRDPEPEGRPEPIPLDPAVTATLRDLMTQVVANGTGTAAAVPGRVMGGKTGTAQFDTSNPDATHAWFVGWVQSQGEPIGFAVLVEEGGVGGRVAAPIAHDFVELLPA